MPLVIDSLRVDKSHKHAYRLAGQNNFKKPEWPMPAFSQHTLGFNTYILRLVATAITIYGTF